jgi:hypothetical protein
MKPKLAIGLFICVLLVSCATACAQFPAGSLLAVDGAAIGGTAITINLTLTSNSTAPTLSWTQTGTPTSNAIWRNRNGAGFALLATQSGALTTYTDSEAFSGSDYRSYKVIPSGGTESNLADAAHDYLLLGTTVSYPNLVVLYGSGPNFDNPPFALDFADPGNLDSVSLPALKHVIGLVNLTIYDPTATNPVPVALEFPALETITGDLVLSGTEVLSFSFPSLISISGTNECSSLLSTTNLSFPVLTTIGGPLNINNTFAMSSLSFPSLVTVGGNVNMESAQTLVNLSFPSLVSFGGSVFGGVFCFALVNLSVPMLVFTNGQTVDFSFGVLSAASVNQILARAVASNVTGMFMELSYDCEAPTGQGILDKATLIAVSPAPPGGNTVNTN